MRLHGKASTALCAMVALACASPGASPSSGTGASFTAEQADRGRDLFRARCTECHYSGEFVASRFKYRWSTGSAGSLYAFVRTSMPETAPGSLEPDEAIELVTYILRMNGFEPGGADLPPDRTLLDDISLASIRRN